MLVHGDDFVTAGKRSELLWLQTTMEKRFESKHSRLGNSEGAVQQLKILNRSIKLTSEGIVYEADTRHVPAAIAALGLGDARSVSTPSVRDHGERRGADMDDVELNLLVED